MKIPLEKVKQILSFRDNEKIINLLMEYRQEALRLSAYYQHVADDILWYGEEHQHILQRRILTEIEKKWLDCETVIIGNLNRDAQSYHANLQEVVKDEIHQTPSIRKKYGYILDLDKIYEGEVVKRREYLKLGKSEYENIPSEYLYILPEGMYAVFTLHIQNEQADFTPLINWLQENGETVDMIFAEEIGLQLFDYIRDYYCEIKAHLKQK